jgi:hypothetical protein
VIADIRDVFVSELDAGRRSALISWLAFTGALSGVRGITHAIRAGKGPFKNLSAGGEHDQAPAGCAGAGVAGKQEGAPAVSGCPVLGWAAGPRGPFRLRRSAPGGPTRSAVVARRVPWG